MRRLGLIGLFVVGCALPDTQSDEGLTYAEGNAALGMGIAKYDISHPDGGLQIVGLSRENDKIANLSITYPKAGEIETEAITQSGLFRAITVDIASVRFNQEADAMLPVSLPISNASVIAMVTDPVVARELDAHNVKFRIRLPNGEIGYGNGYWSSCDAGDNFKGSPYGYSSGNCISNYHGSNACIEQGSYFDGYCGLYGMPWDEQSQSQVHCLTNNQCGGNVGDNSGWRMCGPFPQNTCSPCGYIGPEGCVKCGSITATCGQ